MGNYFTVNMEENFKKNQEFIQSINKIKVFWLYTLIKNILFNKNLTIFFILDGTTDTVAISDARTTSGDANCKK